MNDKSVLGLIKNPPKKYRPIPFWSWNEKLNTDESKRQISLMNSAGIGGFFMHARGGLQTEYMGDEWFENVEASVDEAKAREMLAWAYDENGWPSGFGNGTVNGMGVEYQQKYLRMDERCDSAENTIYRNGKLRFYYEVNPFYVDTLDKEVIKEFIKVAYEPYYEKFQNRIEGFFTDEPQISRNGIPWSLRLPEAYKKEYGEELLPRLSHLFFKEEGYKETRVKFWRLVTKLFSDSFLKQIYEWCDERGLKLTGHLVTEETLLSQLTSNGACMPHYRYFHIPGMDWLGRNISNPVTALQVASVAAQMGKKQVLSETFALCGHNVSFSELRRIYEWQMSRGINLLCQHLEGYSLRGIRKRDYPPALNYQQPWWDEYEKFNTAMSRIGMLICEGETDVDTLLLHPQVSAWACFDNAENEGISELESDFIGVIELLEKKHISFHLGDELIMENCAFVRNGKIVIGEMKYSRLLLPTISFMLDGTKKIIEEFKAQGGIVISAEKCPENDVCDNENITYLKRRFDDFDLHYFVNSTPNYQKANIGVEGTKLDIMSGKEVTFKNDYTFTPYDSLVVIERKEKIELESNEKALEALDLGGEWKLKKHTENSLVLDFCDCYFDGVLEEKNMPVISIQSRACDKKRAVDIRCVFNAEVRDVPNEIFLVCETPEKFNFEINGVVVEFCDCGYFCDSSFRKCNVSKFIKQGNNEIVLLCRFSQSEKTYDNIEKSKIFESERNKLTYDMEIENLYLVGDFAVKTDGELCKLDKHASRYSGKPYITKASESISLCNIERQGFLNFAGSITVERKFNLINTSKKLAFNMRGINAVAVKINGVDFKTVIFDNTELDISDALTIGENTVELVLTNNLRNLLGPHHLEEGESYHVGPFSFFKGDTFWSWTGKAEPWNDGYCIVDVSLCNMKNL